MKFLIAGVLALFAASNAAEIRIHSDECPHDVEVTCIDDINKVYAPCEKAAKEHGVDLPADLECLKYLLQTEKDCWPCICLVAETNHWKIKGCD